MHRLSILESVDCEEERFSNDSPERSQVPFLLIDTRKLAKIMDPLICETKPNKSFVINLLNFRDAIL